MKEPLSLDTMSFSSKPYIEEGKPHFLFRLLSVSFFEGFLFKQGKNNAAIVCVA